MADTFWVGISGHGGHSAPPAEMEYVAIPPSVTIRVHHTDLLAYGDDDSVYWDQIGWCREELNSHAPAVNNLELHGDPALADPDFVKLFGLQAMMGPGTEGLPDPLRLCAGDPESCPSTQEEIENGRTHACDGLLGILSHYGLEGRVWLILTREIRRQPAEVLLSNGSETSSAAAQEPPRIGAEHTKERVSKAPSSWARDIRRANRAVVREARDGAKLYFMLADVSEETLFLLSSDRFFKNSHKGDYLQTVLSLRATTEGTIVVRNLLGNLKGRFEVIDLHSKWRRIVLEFLRECDEDYETRFYKTNYRTDTPPKASRPARELAGISDRVAGVNAKVVQSLEKSTRAYYLLGGGLFMVSRDVNFKNHRRDLNLVKGDPKKVSGRLVIHPINATIVIEGDLSDDRRQAVSVAVPSFCGHEIRFDGGRRDTGPAERSHFAEAFISTEPHGDDWAPIDEAGLRRANIATLQNARPSPHLTDPIDLGNPSGNFHELNFIFAKNILLLSSQADFRNHSYINIEYARRTRRSDERIKGIMLLHAPVLTSGRDGTLEVVPESVMSGEQEHRMRLAIRKLCRREVSFFG